MKKGEAIRARPFKKMEKIRGGGMKKRFGWWAKFGHWCHVSFVRALDHWMRGGKIKFDRW